MFANLFAARRPAAARTTRPESGNRMGASPIAESPEAASQTPAFPAAVSEGVTQMSSKRRSAWVAMLGWIAIAVVVLAPGSFPSVAFGSILESHAFVGVIGLNGDTYPQSRITQVGEGPLDTGRISGGRSPAGGQPFSTSAQARADITADRLLKAYSAAQATGGGLFDGQMGSAGVAAWRDVAFVASQPTALRLAFRLDGDLSAWRYSDLGFSNDWAELGITTTSAPTSFFNYEGGRAIFLTSWPFDYEAVVYYGNQQQSVSAPGAINWLAEGFFADTGLRSWDSFQYDDGHFTGYFHIDTPYDESLGGYGWGVSLSARTAGRNGEGVADAFSTLVLQSVALPDGTPVPATFDSGMTLAPAVPEPCSFVLWSGLGAMGLAAAWRRRRAAAAA